MDFAATVLITTLRMPYFTGFVLVLVRNINILQDAAFLGFSELLAALLKSHLTGVIESYTRPEDCYYYYYFVEQYFVGAREFLHDLTCVLFFLFLSWKKRRPLQ